MKTLKEYVSESLLDDEDDILNTSDDKLEEFYKQNIIDWIKEHYNNLININNITFDDKRNEDGKYIVNCKGGILIKNKNITSLTNNRFIWGEVEEDFYCGDCRSLKSLEGAPKEVGGNFNCSDCRSLKSLEGAPEKVGGNFYCGDCNSLKSLEGAPKEVGGNFNCGNCNSLKSLEGAPGKIGGSFYCGYCKSLKSLKGAPEKVGGHFDCRRCVSLESLEGAPKEVGGHFDCGAIFTEKDVKSVSNVKGKIIL